MRIHHVLAAACLPFVAQLCFAQTPATPSASATQTLNVSANLVVVPVTVRDGKDHLIRTLTRDDFTLTVDGKPQPFATSTVKTTCR